MNSDLKRTWLFAATIIATLLVLVVSVSFLTRSSTPDPKRQVAQAQDQQGVIAPSVEKNTEHVTHGLMKMSKASGVLPAGHTYTLSTVTSETAPQAVDVDGQPYDQTKKPRGSENLPVSSKVTITHVDKNRKLLPDEMSRMLRSIVVDQDAIVVQHPTKPGFTIASNEIVASAVNVKKGHLVISGLFDRQLCDEATGATVELKQACDFSVKLKDVPSP